MPSSANSRPTVAVPKSKAKGHGKSKSTSSTTRTVRPSTPTEDLPEYYDLEGDQSMELGTHPEESMSLAQAIYDNDPIYRPENRAELEEIIRQGREATLRLGVSTLEEEGFEEEDFNTYDWETPGS